jgi:DNA-binding transcriptional ArsR family regulator
MSYEIGVKELLQGYRALSDPTRLRMVHLLGHQPLCVCHLQEILHLPQVPVSQHLAYLRKAGATPNGKFIVFYPRYPEGCVGCWMDS